MLVTKPTHMSKPARSINNWIKRLTPLIPFIAAALGWGYQAYLVATTEAVYTVGPPIEVGDKFVRRITATNPGPGHMRGFQLELTPTKGTCRFVADPGIKRDPRGKPEKGSGISFYYGEAADRHLPPGGSFAVAAIWPKKDGEVLPCAVSVTTKSGGGVPVEPGHATQRPLAMLNFVVVVFLVIGIPSAFVVGVAWWAVTRSLWQGQELQLASLADAHGALEARVTGIEQVDFQETVTPTRQRLPSLDDIKPPDEV